MDITTIPSSIYDKAQEIGVIITMKAWASLTILQRLQS
jgi:hypothetical protein